MLGRMVSVFALLSICLLPAAAQAPANPAAAVKDSLQKSMAALRSYEWIETTAVSVKGEEKSRVQNSCYYGADGKLQKVPVGAHAEDKKPGGLRGRKAEKKSEEMSASVKEALGLLKQYVPIDPARIQSAIDAGRLSVTPPNSKGNVQVAIKDYLKAGDTLTLDVNAASSQIANVSVATFTEKEKDAVGVKIAFGAFADGTVYPAKIQLDVAKQELAVAIENSGYKKAGG